MNLEAKATLLEVFDRFKKKREGYDLIMEGLGYVLTRADTLKLGDTICYGLTGVIVDSSQEAHNGVLFIIMCEDGELNGILAAGREMIYAKVEPGKN